MPTESYKRRYGDKAPPGPLLDTLSALAEALTPGVVRVVGLGGLGFKSSGCSGYRVQV